MPKSPWNQKKFTYFVAAALLILMTALAVFSMKDDSAVMDEVSHLPAGYSYISQADMRINPEHPPMIKDLAGGMVWLWSKIFNQPINFPANIPAWQTEVNGQWNFGFDFMYNEGNNADMMLFAGRLPMILILLILGLYVFKWANELFGKKAALLSLFLYCFSPTFIAHGRFITTDVAAAAAIFIASYYFIRWLKNPSAKNLIIAGLVFGLAQLAKFSVFLLIPLFAFVVLVWIYLKIREEQDRSRRLKNVFWPLIAKYLGGLILIFGIGYIFIVWPVYLYHVANYPVARQISDSKTILATFGMRPIANLIIWWAGIPGLRALAEYGLGLAMVLQRAAGGNTNYFLGEVSNLGSHIYFPFVYLIKETLTLHILTLIALILGLVRLFKEKLYRPKAFRQMLNKNITGLLMISFIALYWYQSVKSPLNIGVRHVLPTFAFIFLLVSQQIANWLKANPKVLADSWRHSKVLLGKYLLLAVLLVWQAASVISVYPSFLAYFNELAGGPANGYKYAVDSNLDWGQDLKRLTQFVEKNNIDRLYLDFFGGGSPTYYLDGKYIPWWGSRSPNDLNRPGGWLAISASFLQGGRGKPVPGFYYDQAGVYNWLNNFTPIEIIGHSIFVYYIPPNSVAPAMITQ